jgi:DNA polymerase-3 subunit epsilon/CBS domain-containing protein
MDQDNALVFADDAADGADRWFAAFGVHLTDLLHEVGVPYCPGGVMARNQQWRGSVASWRQRIVEWLARSNPQDLLFVDIFFDLRGVHGDLPLADRLWLDALDAASGNAGFAKLLVEAAGAAEPARSWFGGFKTREGRIDLKRAGLFGLVSTARALAMRHHVAERSTAARLAAIKALKLGSERDLDDLLEAHEVLLQLILKQQLVDVQNGRPASNAVEVKRLSHRQRERLHFALARVEYLGPLSRDLLFEES